LLLSLRTLFWSNPDVESVRVYVVSPSEDVPKWGIRDDRVKIEAVPDISSTGAWGRYWGTNKLHLARSTADRVIYLDTDVMILDDLAKSYADSRADLIARPAPDVVSRRHWNPERWSQKVQQAGASPDMPFYSPGFMVFHNGAHQRLRAEWEAVIERILSGETPFSADKHAEMNAFSVAASIVGLSHHAMADEAHRYAMIGEGAADAVVWHLGTPGFFRHYIPQEKKLGLDKEDLPVARPAFLWLRALQSRLRYKYRAIRRGGVKREATLEY